MEKNSISHKYHLTLGIIGVIAVIIFTLQNSEVVIVRFLFWKLEMSRVILIIATLVIGISLGYIYRGYKKK